MLVTLRNCWIFSVFQRSKGEKILGVFEVFLGIFEKTKETEGQGCAFMSPGGSAEML